MRFFSGLHAHRAVLIALFVVSLRMLLLPNLENPTLAHSAFQFTLAPEILNAAPIILAVAVSPIAQGSIKKTVKIATVSDAETEAGNLIVNVGALPTGVIVADIANSNGIVTAQITVDCNMPIGTITIPLTVANRRGLANSTNLFVKIEANVPPVLGAYGLATLNLNSSVEFSPFTQQSDNGSIQRITAAAPNFTGTFSVNLTTGVISIGKAGPVGQYTVTVTGVDNCGATATTQFNLNVLQAGAPLEADVTPRTTGNGTVTIADWTQVGRFVAGVDTILESSEFQRADCAPRATTGDGKITVADWVQAGRYAAGLDTGTNAAGPTRPDSTAPALGHQEAQPQSARFVRAVSRPIFRGQVAALPLEFNALGNENALGFTLSFDSRWLNFYRLTTATDITLTLNRKQSGQLGILLAKPAGQVFAAGTQTIITLEFIPSGGEDMIQTTLDFSDQIVQRGGADADAAPLSALSLIAAELTISGRATAHVSAASYLGASAARDSIVSAFGTDLAPTTYAATTMPLPETLGGMRVTIQDSAGHQKAAPLFFVSPGQINYLVPDGLSDGLAIITITHADAVISRGLLHLERVAPALFTADASGKGLAAANVQHLRADGSERYERVAMVDPITQRLIGQPIELQAEEQTFLLLYGTGLRYRNDLSAVNARLGGLPVEGLPIEVLYVGPQGGYAGLDQINLRLPLALRGRGVVTVELEIDGYLTNPVAILIK